jgi:hypothetical protein
MTTTTTTVFHLNQAEAAIISKRRAQIADDELRKLLHDHVPGHVLRSLHSMSERMTGGSLMRTIELLVDATEATDHDRKRILDGLGGLSRSSAAEAALRAEIKIDAIQRGVGPLDSCIVRRKI